VVLQLPKSLYLKLFNRWLSRRRCEGRQCAWIASSNFSLTCFSSSNMSLTIPIRAQYFNEQESNSTRCSTLHIAITPQHLHWTTCSRVARRVANRRGGVLALSALQSENEHRDRTTPQRLTADPQLHGFLLHIKQRNLPTLFGAIYEVSIQLG
jgi:hypothetical protein